MIWYYAVSHEKYWAKTGVNHFSKGVNVKFSERSNEKEINDFVCNDKLSVKGKDPDGDKLYYKLWQYLEPDSYKGEIKIQDAEKPQASLEILEEGESGQTVHIICEVTDGGEPKLTRYARVIMTLE